MCKKNKCCVNCLFCYQEHCANDGIYGEQVRYSNEMDKAQRKLALKNYWEKVFEAEQGMFLQLKCIKDKWEYPITVSKMQDAAVKNMLIKNASCPNFYLYNKKGHKTIDACEIEREAKKERNKHWQTIAAVIIAALISELLTTQIIDKIIVYLQQALNLLKLH